MSCHINTFTTVFTGNPLSFRQINQISKNILDFGATTKPMVQHFNSSIYSTKSHHPF